MPIPQIIILINPKILSFIIILAWVSHILLFLI